MDFFEGIFNYFFETENYQHKGKVQGSFYSGGIRIDNRKDLDNYIKPNLPSTTNKPSNSLEVTVSDGDTLVNWFHEIVSK